MAALVQTLAVAAVQAPEAQQVPVTVALAGCWAVVVELLAHLMATVALAATVVAVAAVKPAVALAAAHV